MAEAVRSVQYYYVTVPDKPGAGASVLQPLKEAGVNLVAYLGFPSGRGKSQIDLVPEDAESFKEAARRAHLKLSRTKRAFLIQGDDRTGAVADLTRKLADAKVNVTAAAAAAGDGRYGMILWVAPRDFAKASKALGVQTSRPRDVL
jgi:predicted amino acid-binding ACT domain protein